jgi:hypothetical protein
MPTQILARWPHLLSEAAAAEYLSIGSTTLRGLNLPSVRVSRRVLYDRLALDQWATALSGVANSSEDLDLGSKAPLKKRVPSRGAN